MNARKIMVVDDTPDTVELAKAVLELSGFEVLPFTDPALALESLSKNPLPDLLILDMRMPLISGPQFCERVRSDGKTKKLRIAFFTASADAETALLKKFNVLGYIFKPFDNKKFVAQVNKYLAP